MGSKALENNLGKGSIRGLGSKLALERYPAAIRPNAYGIKVAAKAKSRALGWAEYFCAKLGTIPADERALPGVKFCQGDPGEVLRAFDVADAW